MEKSAFLIEGKLFTKFNLSSINIFEFFLISVTSVPKYLKLFSRKWIFKYKKTETTEEIKRSCSGS